MMGLRYGHGKRLFDGSHVKGGIIGKKGEGRFRGGPGRRAFKKREDIGRLERWKPPSADRKNSAKTCRHRGRKHREKNGRQPCKNVGVISSRGPGLFRKDVTKDRTRRIRQRGSRMQLNRGSSESCETQRAVGPHEKEKRSRRKRVR